MITQEDIDSMRDDDIIKRLRNPDTVYPIDIDAPDFALYYSAADEIERLRDALARLHGTVCQS